MRRFDPLKPITRRALRLNYISPLVCRLAPSLGSGSGSGGVSSVSTLDILPVLQKVGPVLSLTQPTASQVRLAWTTAGEAYVVYRAASEEGTFSVIASGVLSLFYVDTPSVSGIYFYRVVALEPDFGLTEPSNLVSANV